MLIRYWSSDVCSSDLVQSAQQVFHLVRAAGQNGRPQPLVDGIQHGAGLQPVLVGQAAVANQLLGQQFQPLDGIAAAAPPRLAHVEQDRKSVMEGKRVLVRVDLGGGRTSKKKNT